MQSGSGSVLSAAWFANTSAINDKNINFSRDIIMVIQVCFELRFEWLVLVLVVLVLVIVMFLFLFFSVVRTNFSSSLQTGPLKSLTIIFADH